MVQGMRLPLFQYHAVKAPAQASDVCFSGQVKRQPAQSAALFSTDLDETLINWHSGQKSYDELKLARNAKVIQQWAPQMAVHINTGRGLVSMQQATKVAAPILKKIPVDFLSLNNGQELYVNRKHQRSDQWIAQLKPGDQDATWQKIVQLKTGWTLPKVQQVREAVFANAGFKEIKKNLPGGGVRQYKDTRTFVKPMENGVIRAVQLFADQPGFKYLTIQNNRQVYGPQEHQEAMSILKAMVSGLKQQRVSAETGFMEVHDPGAKAHFGIYTLIPKDINKGSAVQTVLERYLKAPKGVITAGDHEYNDGAALSPERFEIGKNKSVTNYPIVSGRRDALFKHLKPHPQVVFVDQADLGPGLEKQVGKIFNRQA